MSKVLNPLSSEDASGSLGQHLTFVHWKGIKVVRPRVMTPNPRTSPQLSRRAAFLDCQRYWGQLTADEAAAWNELAAIQPMRNRFGWFKGTGLNWFTRCNYTYRFLNSPLWPIREPAALPRPSPITGLYLLCSAAGFMSFQFDVPDYPALSIAMLWFQGPYDVPSRRLRTPEQRFVASSPTVLGYMTGLAAHLEVGQWGWFGIRVHPAGYWPHFRLWIWAPRTDDEEREYHDVVGDPGHGSR